ncbi:hypothetical protein ACFX2F_007192 [Malus domestica]
MSKRVRPGSQLAAKNKKDEHNFGKATRRGKHLGKNKRNCNAVDKITRSPHKLVFSLFVLKGAASTNKWIQFAMNKRVQVLELVFHIESYNRWGDLYTFPHKLLGLENGSTLKLEHMRSDIPSLRSCGYNTGFKLLRVLHFQLVDVTGEVLEYFLSNCPVLERLTVHSAFTNLVNLRVIGPSVALKYLDIKFCPYLQSIEICDANLLSLDYEGSAINMLVSNVPLLVEVSISMSLDFAVDADDGEGAMYNRNHVFPVLTNLKHLELRVKADDRWALCRLTSFMKASPFLQRLVLKMCFRAPSEFDSGLGGGRKKKGEVLRPPHCNLKVVEIVGYRARPCAAEHVKYLIENVVGLEKVVIDPVRRWAYQSSEIGRGVEELKEEEKARDYAKKRLKKIVPSSIRFECL